MADDVHTGATPPSLDPENQPAHRGRYQGIVLGLLGAASLAAAVTFATIFFGGAGKEVPAGGTELRPATLTDGWTGPPADAREADLIPQALGKWDLTAADANPGNGMLGVDLDGFHGTYNQVGVPDVVDLAVYAADADTAGGVLNGMKDRVSDEARFPGVRVSEKRLPGTDRTLKFDVPEGKETPELHGLAAHAGGWLMVARSATEDELAPFLAEYMRTVESDGTAEPPTDVPAQGSRGIPDQAPGAGLNSGGDGL